MAKKTNQTAKAKKQSIDKKPATKAAPKTVTPPPAKDAEVIDAEEVELPANKNMKDVTIGDLMKTGNSTGLDANHRVELNGQVIDLFVKNPNAANRFGTNLVEAMTDIAAIGVVTAIADEVVNGNSTFATTIKREAYEKLLVAANALHIELPPVKALPPTEDGGVTLTSKDVTIDDNTKNDFKEEKAIVEKANKKEIEMDPVKVASLDQQALKDALEAILITGLRTNQKSIKDVLVEAVDFMIAYRSEQYKDDAEKKQAYVESPMYAVLNDIFSIVRPIIHLRGIGNGMMRLIENDKSPLSAFVILRDQLLEKKFDPKDPDAEIKACWDDQSIADATRALVELACEDHIKRFEDMLAKCDKKDKNKDSYQAEIDRANKILDYLHNVSFDIINEFEETEELDEKSACAKAFVKIMKSYYPKQAATAAYYEGLNENLAQRAGVILNLFRTPGNKNQLFSEDNIYPLDKKTEEPLVKVQEKLDNGIITLSNIPFCYRHLMKVKKNPKKD